MSEDRRPIIIKRKKVVHAHHGGSWKIALADFMTAMMALFLVLWILATASEEQLQGVAEYFSTPLAVAIAGGDRTSSSDSAIPGGGPDPIHEEGERMRIDMRTQSRSSDEIRRFRNLQQRMETLIEGDPQLRELRRQIRFDMTPEGLRVQLVDTEQRPMFELGSDTVAPYMRNLLRAIAPLLNDMDNPLSLSGHTDSIPYSGGYRGYSNWELSSDRANASRRELVAGGLDPDKLLRVAGMGDRVPLSDTAPDDPVNRRIAIVVLDERSAQAIRSQGLPGGGSVPSPSTSRLAEEIDTSPVEAFRQGLDDTLSDD
ncbi:chemotaxis protein MotB [Franzmannia pantelleriensis]|uniref:Chemotaxis protein MotB n=1 Tax=Franzmannia pantelleriensis TaxID=48727 RepID=A0A1G9EMS7_9GAMM|nr:flagellar motor protein MotB [Halomonas pantelleriensis]SDK77315.1 chemotaxis protein MotB [Halomonas pantelleriensis]